MPFTEILFLISLKSDVKMLYPATFIEEDERQNESLVPAYQAWGPSHPGVGCFSSDTRGMMDTAVLKCSCGLDANCSHFRGHGVSATQVSVSWLGE